MLPPVQTGQTCLSSAIQHCWTQHVLGPFKRVKLVCQTLSNIVGCNIFYAVEHNDQSCSMALDNAGWSLFKIFIHPCSTFLLAQSKWLARMTQSACRYLVATCLTAVGYVWTFSHPTYSNTLQSRTKAIQQHQPRLDSICQTCLTRFWTGFWAFCEYI